MRKGIFISLLAITSSFLCACSVANYTDINIPSPNHQHTFSSKWSYDETMHWHASYCGHDIKIDEGIHEFSEWKTVDPEYGYKSQEARNCNICGYKETRGEVDPNAGKDDTDDPKKDEVHEGVDYSDKLTFELSWDGKSYIVDGPDEIITEKFYIIIPSEYNGLPVTEIKYSAFSYLPGLTYISIPESVITINFDAFTYCESLTSIFIPKNVLNIRSGIFSYCDNLKEIKVDKNNENYDSRDDSNCIIKTSTNTIIAGCNATKIPSSVEGIDKFAFENCLGLTSIYIDENIKFVNKGAFEGCRNVTSIIVNENNRYLDSRNNSNAIINTSTNVLITGCKNTIIPNGITKIEDYAFTNCDDLTSISIPDSVKSIGSLSFSFCDNLESIKMSKNLEEIDDYAFDYDKNLKSIILPKTLKTIGKEVFKECSNLSIYYEGSYSTWINNFKGLEEGAKEILFYSDSKPSTSDGILYWHYVNNEPTRW